jgi:pre-mRNA-processing factor 8
MPIDDWLKSFSSYTAFSRLILLLRGLHVNNEKGCWFSFQLHFNSSLPFHAQDFQVGKLNSVNIASLTVSEVRDVILGQEIAAPSVQQQQMAELEKSTEAQSQITAVQTLVYVDALQA